ncbi:MAG: DegT/DnrJ/EryC1/StrS family aminotransferase [Alphaproteobacteria bacterium]
MATTTTQDEITFVGIKQQKERLRADIERRLGKVLDHGAFIGGPEIAELEAALKARTGAAAVIACASGTDAIIIPLMAEKLTREDAVFLPAFTYNATANSVLIAGATPVFVDVDRNTFNMDVRDLEARIDSVKAEGHLRPRAVIAVDLYGLPADYAALGKLCAKHDLLLISDAAQSFGGGIGNARVGALAPITTTSFFPTKTLGGYGDGGAIFAMDEARATVWEEIRWHGTEAKMRKESVRVGMNGRIDSFQCAVLLSKLEVFDEEWDRREAFGQLYRERLLGRVHMHADQPRVKHAWGLFTVALPNRDRVREALAKKGIPTAIYYSMPLHQHAAFKPYAPAGGMPVSERLANEVASLPFHPYMSEAQVHRVCDALLDLL